MKMHEDVFPLFFLKWSFKGKLLKTKKNLRPGANNPAQYSPLLEALDKLF